MQPEYLELRRLFGQIYVAQKNTGDRFQTISTNGKVIFEFPPDTIGVNVLPNVSHGAIAYGIRIAGEKKKFVYIDQAGKPFPDNFVLSEFGLAAMAKKVAIGPVQRGLVDDEGKVVQPSQAAFFSVVSPDRIIKYVRNVHFNAEAWKNPRPMGGPPGMYRVDHFAYFLNDFDLIGMPRKRVEELLGSPDRSTAQENFYWLAQAWCGNGWTGIEIEFEGDKAWRWRETWTSSGASHAAPWVTTNLTFDSETTSRLLDTEPVMKLVPKENIR